ncbi:PAPA-1 domain-containing protein [Balamuthia mandrillaris]
MASSSASAAPLNVNNPAMPSAWAIRTKSDQYVRLGFTPEDLSRPYNTKDVLEEVAMFYRIGLNVAEAREVTVVPILPQGAKGVRTIKDFVQVRGWYAVNVFGGSQRGASARRPKPGKKKTTREEGEGEEEEAEEGEEDEEVQEGEDTPQGSSFSLEDDLIEQVQSLQMDFEVWKAEEEEKMKVKIEMAAKELEERWEGEEKQRTKTLLQRVREAEDPKALIEQLLQEL